MMRVFGVGQDLRGPFDPLVDRGRLAVDQARRAVVGLMVQEPRFAQHAGPLGLDDVIVLDRQVDVVAHAAAERAGGVLHDFERGISGCRFFGKTHGMFVDDSLVGCDARRQRCRAKCVSRG